MLRDVAGAQHGAHGGNKRDVAWFRLALILGSAAFQGDLPHEAARPQTESTDRVDDQARCKANANCIEQAASEDGEYLDAVCTLLALLASIAARR